MRHCEPWIVNGSVFLSPFPCHRARRCHSGLGWPAACAFYRVVELRCIEWLVEHGGYVVLRLRLETPCRDHDNRDSSQVGIGIYLAQHFSAVDVREGQIERYQVGVDLACQTDSFMTLLCDHNAAAAIFEKDAQNGRDCRVILDYQNRALGLLRHAGSYWPSPGGRPSLAVP